MASSNITMNNCAACMKNSNEQKIKPGITLCEGCHQAFCLSHFVEHRQVLNDKLDGIAEQRDSLRARIVELPTRMPKEHLKTIDNWESTMLETVTKAANNTRQHVHELIINEMERECSELTTKITSFRSDDNYFETDLLDLQTKTEKLNEELNDLSNLHRIQLNLPTLDCSNIVYLKPAETHVSLDITENNVAVIPKPEEQYRSFIESFLTINQPSTNITTPSCGYLCVSPTMLIYINYSNIQRLVFYRQSTSNFKCEYMAALDIRWSSWLQQFIVLTSKNIVVVDAVEKQSKKVVEEKHTQLQCFSHWKSRCVIADNTNRLLLHEMNNNLSDWLLLYCSSVPTTCGEDDKITAIGLNENYIVLSVSRSNLYYFAVHKRDMTHCSTINLTYPCTTIQALPQSEWLLYNCIQELYSTIDVKHEQHEEPYLSSSYNTSCIVTSDEADKIMVVLQPRQSTADFQNQTKKTATKQTTHQGYYVSESKYNIEVYIR